MPSLVHVSSALEWRKAGCICLLPRKRAAKSGTWKGVLTGFLCGTLIGCCQPNDPTCRNLSIGPSGAEVAGVAVGIGAVVATAVAVEVHHAHHTLNGCVSNGPGGMQLTANTKIYMLSGNTANIAAGEHVRLHGTRVKHPKHSSADPVFLVERQNKDYGPCKMHTSSTAVQ